MGAHQHVVSDDSVVEDLLLGILDLVREAGGWFAPDVRVHAMAGQISIERAGGDGPLLHIPEPLWVRVDAFEWGAQDGQLTVLGVPDDVGDLELAMAFLQAGLTNQCRRLSWLESSHPALAPDLGSATIDVLRMMVPGFRSVELPAVDVLWATRCFRMPTTSDPVPQRVLVPLVDLLNHHRDGAAGSLRDQSFDVNTRRPFGTPECALTYGMSRDALEMATVYGFADASVTWAHSAPMAFDLDGLVVRVDGVTRTSSGQPVELSTLADDSGLVVRGLTFERGALGATVTRLSDQTGLSPEAARSIIGHVLRENLDMTDVLISQCGAHDTFAAATISTAAAIHGGILSSAMEADPIP